MAEVRGDRALGAALADACEKCSRSIIADVAEEMLAHGLRSDLVSPPLLLQTAFTIGFDIGLSVAISDIAHGRRYQDFIAREVHKGDPESIGSRESAAGELLRAVPEA